jgi:GNAT superfamily N-acetyltransferase
MIREATAADLPELGRMFDSYRKVHGARSRVSACAEFLAERLEHPDSKTFLACLDDRAVGFIQLHARYASLRLKRNWILADLFVLPRYRRQGFARQLVMHALAFAEESGSDAVHVTTNEGNEAAVALYRSFGFERVEGTLIFSVSLTGTAELT